MSVETREKAERKAKEGREEKVERQRRRKGGKGRKAESEGGRRVKTYGTKDCVPHHCLLAVVLAFETGERDESAFAEHSLFGQTHHSCRNGGAVEDMKEKVCQRYAVEWGSPRSTGSKIAQYHDLRW
jgi:hypothetical protein